MKKIFTLIVMLAATLGMQAQDTWTVVGTAALTGTNWLDDVEAAKANDMVTEDGNVYTWTKTDVALKAGGKYELKIVKNHSWDEEVYGGFAGGQESDNYVIDIAENGKYTVVVTFNHTEISISHQATKTGEAEFGETTWTVAGVAALCGSGWDPADASNDMVSTDGVNFTWTKTDLPLEADVTYQFKVVADHAWGEEYGDPAGGNYEFQVPENGAYTLVITFSTDTKIVGHEATKTGEAHFDEKTWTVAGVTEICGSSWDPSDTSNDMTKMDEGYYELTRYNLHLAQSLGGYEYKVVANHAWGEEYPSQNAKLYIDEEGDYDVTFMFTVSTKTVDALAEVATGITGVTVKVVPSAAIYNLQGQRVNGNFRGIAIQNGKKMLMK